MSYVFSGRIQSAMFVDPPQNTVIELLYGEGTELTAFHLNVDYSSDEFLAFIDEWSLEKVEKTSRDNARANKLAKQTQINLTLTPEMVTAFILKNNNDKNMVFDTKLALLETLATADSREQKMKIRKAKTIAQLYSVYHEYNI